MIYYFQIDFQIIFENFMYLKNILTNITRSQVYLTRFGART